MVFALLSPPSRADSPVVAFDIAAQPMASALQTLAEQADLQILFAITDVNALTAPSVTGRMSSEDAVAKLLWGTTLECVRKGDVLVVRERAITKAAVRSATGQVGTLRLAEADPPGASSDKPATPAPNPSPKPSPPAQPDATPLGETVVTGTWIRGAQIASPLTVVDRVEIERTGFTTIQQVVDRLPQNYGGGDSDGTVLSPGGSGRNIGFGSSVNLRGLGSDSTLVLLDGHRLAPASLGQYVDISMIPLSAIESIDVLTDGASATYGSDAVAGVVNLKLRNDYEGAETRVQGGAATEGHIEEYQFGQSFGHRWSTGHALVTYEYYERDNLDANDRDYSAGVLDRFDLYAEQERQSLLASANQQLSESILLKASALYSERDAVWHQANYVTLEPQFYDTRNRQVAASLAGVSEFGDSWQAELAVTYGQSTSHREAYGPLGEIGRRRHELDIVSGELTADGSPFMLGGVPARLAVGAAWRTETYDEVSYAVIAGERDVGAGFLEAVLPLLGAASEQLLELSLAARHERYSDFGDSTNPKVGLVWEPTPVLRFRSTWGTSFRAPLLSELDELDYSPVLADLPDPSAPGGTTLTMVIFGNNTELQPEEAATLTLGVDFQSPSDPATALSLTYFDTEFEDRIVEPLPFAAIFNVFAEQDIYAALITRDPDDAVITELATHPNFLNIHGPYVPSDVGAIVDKRLRNLSATQVNGIDLAASTGFNTRAGAIQLALTGTYLLDYDEQVSTSAPTESVLDTAFHLIDLKLRGSLAWSRGRWGADLYLNYADGYTNDTVTPPTPISSWFTVDLQFRFEADWLSGVRFALSAQNVLDEDPPYLSSPLPVFNVGYDPTNANPMGRFVALNVTATW